MEHGRTIGRAWLEPGSLMTTWNRSSSQGLTDQHAHLTCFLLSTQGIRWAERLHTQNTLWSDEISCRRVGQIATKLYSAWYALYGRYARRDRCNCYWCNENNTMNPDSIMTVLSLVPKTQTVSLRTRPLMYISYSGHADNCVNASARWLHSLKP